MEISDIDVRKFVALCVDDYGQDEDDQAAGYKCLFSVVGMTVECSFDDGGRLTFIGRDAARARLLIDHLMNGMPGTLENQQRFDHVKERIASFVTAKEIRLGVIK